jgi:hypothetical protein
VVLQIHLQTLMCAKLQDYEMDMQNTGTETRNCWASQQQHMKVFYSPFGNEEVFVAHKASFPNLHVHLSKWISACGRAYSIVSELLLDGFWLRFAVWWLGIRLQLRGLGCRVSLRVSWSCRPIMLCVKQRRVKDIDLVADRMDSVGVDVPRTRQMNSCHRGRVAWDEDCSAVVGHAAQRRWTGEEIARWTKAAHEWLWGGVVLMACLVP